MDHSPPGERTVELIMRLASVAEATAERLRVVLLGCSELLPPEVEATALREEIETIENATLTEFFTLFFSHQGILVTSDAVESAVEHVLERAGEDPDGRLGRLSKEAIEVARELSSSRKAA